MPATGVHFNGSLNMPDGETVMREISARIPRGVRRMADGETGERNYWIHAYFAPLGLRVGPETELYFALVPYHPDGRDRRRTVAPDRRAPARVAPRRA
jgi:hypothetical protein